MIVSLTPNPSVDRTIEVDSLVRGAVLRASAVHVDPGGKGVNVARALAVNGHAARAVLPLGGAEGRQLAELLAGEGIDVVVVPIDGAVRSNITVVEPDGTTTKLNEPGPRLGAAEAEAMIDATVRAAAGASWVVVSGSLPPGCDEGIYAELVGRLRATGVRVAVDASGPALRAAVAAGPDLVKPNRDELADAAGCRIVTVADAVAAAGELRRRGAGAVLASLGADGALLVDAAGVARAQAPAIEPRSTVGAGDALLAGFLAGGGDAGALAQAVAWGAAAASLPGSRMPSPADIDLSAVRLQTGVDGDLSFDGTGAIPVRARIAADTDSTLAQGAVHA